MQLKQNLTVIQLPSNKSNLWNFHEVRFMWDVRLQQKEASELSVPVSGHTCTRRRIGNEKSKRVLVKS